MALVVNVKNFEGTIKKVFPQRIWYSVPDNKEIFIDFDECYSNHLNTADEKQHEIIAKAKRVGGRNVDNQPPYIELFTIPLTRFEFNSVSDCYKFAGLIKKSGWRTMDLT